MLIKKILIILYPQYITINIKFKNIVIYVSKIKKKLSCPVVWPMDFGQEDFGDLLSVGLGLGLRQCDTCIPLFMMLLCVLMFVLFLFVSQLLLLLRWVLSGSYLSKKYDDILFFRTGLLSLDRSVLRYCDTHVTRSTMSY